jgi:hypothetical protein
MTCSGFGAYTLPCRCCNAGGLRRIAAADQRAGRDGPPTTTRKRVRGKALAALEPLATTSTWPTMSPVPTFMPSPLIRAPVP